MPCSGLLQVWIPQVIVVMRFVYGVDSVSSVPRHGCIMRLHGRFAPCKNREIRSRPKSSALFHSQSRPCFSCKVGIGWWISNAQFLLSSRCGPVAQRPSPSTTSPSRLGLSASLSFAFVASIAWPCCLVLGVDHAPGDDCTA